MRMVGSALTTKERLSRPSEPRLGHASNCIAPRGDRALILVEQMKVLKQERFEVLKANIGT